MNLIYNDFNSYRYNLTDNNENILYCPLAIDTEYQNHNYKSENYAKLPSQCITVQVSDYQCHNPKIYTHYDSFDIARHDKLKTDFIGLDYLNDNGYDVTLHHKYDKYDLKKPTLIFDLYCHFAMAEIMRVFHHKMLDDVKHLIVFYKKNKGSAIKSANRTRTQHSNGFKTLDYAYLPYTIKYKNKHYQLAIRLFDTIGIAGNRSFDKLSELSGNKSQSKHKLTQHDKENMLITYSNKPDDFDDYSLGDLYLHRNILGIEDLLIETSKELGIVSPLKMTVGSTVANLMYNLICKYYDIFDNKRLRPLLEKANGDFLRKLTDNRALLSKVDGGRCFNNRPLDFKIEKGGCENLEDLLKHGSCLVDVDISGAYGKGLSLQDYPIGTPRTLEFRLNDGNKKPPTLREFIKLYGDDLVEGLWFLRVSSKYKLKYSQDLISSWIISDKQLGELSNDNNDDNIYDYTKIGYSKIFSNEIINGVITYDILDLINNVASKFQRKELLDNLVVVNGAWYSKNDYKDSIDEVLEDVKNFKGESTSEYVNGVLTNKISECHSWTKVNLGELMINKLLETRNNYKKLSKDNSLDVDVRNKYNNLQDYYKLMINTTYGVIVSKYFNVGNVIVGNNITARCRCMAWYLEKGLNSFQTITDGSVFELDKVVYPIGGRDLTMSNCVRGYAYYDKDRHWKLDKLVKYKYVSYKVDGVTQIECLNNNDNSYHDSDNGNDISQLLRTFTINTKKVNHTFFRSIELDVMNHLRILFKNVDVLHKTIINSDGSEQKGYYTLEIKNIAKSAKFHGNANYKLSGLKDISNLDKFIDCDDKYKMRGYKSDRSYGLDFDSFSNELLEMGDDDILDDNIFDMDTKIDVIKDFLDNLDEVVKCKFPYIQKGIIKINEYRNNYQNYYQNTNLIVGGELLTVRLIRELSIGQFLYPNKEIFDSYNTTHNKFKQKYGYGFESLYLDSDTRTLKYGALVRGIDESIMKGIKPRLKGKKHPFYDLFLMWGDECRNRAIIHARESD